VSKLTCELTCFADRGFEQELAKLLGTSAINYETASASDGHEVKEEPLAHYLVLAHQLLVCGFLAREGGKAGNLQAEFLLKSISRKAQSANLDLGPFAVAMAVQKALALKASNSNRNACLILSSALAAAPDPVQVCR